ncbi:hypothetical protein Tco_0977272 [Tanacetum coccineum]|uniref:Uncharacterized protein n=1 Tax=Tanacetum coccineum TaxID=301880 RepID=A0ABQ5EJM2_9ASTR
MSRKGSLSNSAGCNCSSTPSEMTRDYVSYVVDEVLAAGASCSMEVDKGELVGSAGLGAVAAGTRETTLGGGLKYSSNIDWNKIS